MRQLLVSLCVAGLLAGCSFAPNRGGDRWRGAAVPALPKDVATIPDAVPRAEPRSRYGNPAFYEVFGRRYHVLATADDYVETGLASWYGPGFHAETTSNGEAYDMYAMTAAHKTLPLPAYARVTNLDTGKSIVVRINDRGPFVDGRVVHLSYTAAAKLDVIRAGTARVEVRTLRPTGPGAVGTGQHHCGSTVCAALYSGWRIWQPPDKCRDVAAATTSHCYRAGLDSRPIAIERCIACAWVHCAA